MRINTNPATWKIVVAVTLILLTDVYQALVTLGRLPQTPYEVSIIVLHALILAFTFLSADESTPEETPDGT